MIFLLDIERNRLLKLYDTYILPIVSIDRNNIQMFVSRCIITNHHVEVFMKYLKTIITQST